MAKSKVTISIDDGMLQWADELVGEGSYESRSAAIEAALAVLHRKRLDEQFVAALEALTAEDAAEMEAAAEDGIEQWGAELDALDGGWEGLRAQG